MARMINISAETQRLTIAQGPGDKPIVVALDPGESSDFPDGLCAPVKLALREAFPSVIERKSMRRDAAGVRRATVVPVDGKAHRAWLAARKVEAPVEAPVEAQPAPKTRKAKPAPRGKQRPTASPPAQVEELTEGKEE